MINAIRSFTPVSFYSTQSWSVRDPVTRSALFALGGLGIAFSCWRFSRCFQKKVVHAPQPEHAPHYAEPSWANIDPQAFVAHFYERPSANSLGDFPLWAQYLKGIS